MGEFLSGLAVTKERSDINSSVDSSIPLDLNDVKFFRTYARTYSSRRGPPAWKSQRRPEADVLVQLPAVTPRRGEGATAAASIDVSSQRNSSPPRPAQGEMRRERLQRLLRSR